MNNFTGRQKWFTFLVLIGVFLMTACTSAAPAQNAAEGALEAEIHYTLKTGAADGQLVFIGVGGEIDGQINPDLTANVGNTVAITLINDDGRYHDLVIDEFNAATSVFSEVGQKETIQFAVDQVGTFFYYCSVTGHRQAGMEGQMIVSN
jgi:nitrite reductase (NO-forming)